MKLKEYLFRLLQLTELNTPHLPYFVFQDKRSFKRSVFSVWFVGWFLFFIVTQETVEFYVTIGLAEGTIA